MKESHFLDEWKFRIKIKKEAKLRNNGNRDILYWTLETDKIVESTLEDLCLK